LGTRWSASDEETSKRYERAKAAADLNMSVAVKAE
jgi:hypothetical protein